MPSRPSVETVLRERFGFGGFRPGQRELIETVLAGHDALGILPTGGGKSLTYQLPATLLDGLTVIVSPPIALMKDQVDAFNRRGLGRAVAIHSNLAPRDARAALDQARSGAARLLYLAPERLEIPEWRGRLREAAPAGHRRGALRLPAIGSDRGWTAGIGRNRGGRDLWSIPSRGRGIIPAIPR